MSTGKFVLGILAGAAVGTALGILFSPEKGSVTRKNIAQKGIDVKDGIKERVNEFGDFIKGNHKKVNEEKTEAAKQA